MTQHSDCLRYRGGRDATLTQEQPGTQAWKDHRRGTQREPERAVRGVFCLDPRGPVSRHGGWGEEKEMQGQGPPSMLSRAGTGTRAQSLCSSPPATPEPARRLGAWAQSDTALPWMEGAQCPEDPQERTSGEPR